MSYSKDLALTKTKLVIIWKWNSFRKYYIKSTRPASETSPQSQPNKIMKTQWKTA